MHIARICVLLACALPSAAATYSTYIGDAYPYTVSAMAVDAAGNTYLTGSRQVFLPGSYTTSNDVFVTKVDASGNVTLLTAFGGKGSDQGTGIAVDGAGNIYVVGYTSSPDFPLVHALQATLAITNQTGFVVKLNATGSMVYATYLGGTTGSSGLYAVAADAAGNAYVTGITFATDYPATAGLPAGAASDSPADATSAAFFAKISAAGALVYAGGLAAEGRACGTGSSCFTSLVGNGGSAIAVDSAGNAYIGGNTGGTGLPTTPGVLQPSGIGGFVAKVNAAGTAMAYVTLLGTANYYPPPVAPGSYPATAVLAIAVDAAGDAYVVGQTLDPNFPATASAFQPQLNFAGQAAWYNLPPSDAFVAKLNPTASAMVWATFLGGSSADSASRVALDASDNVWVVGATGSTNFPEATGFPNGNEFLAELSADGTSLLHSQLFPANVAASGVAVDGGGTVHWAGANGLVSASAAPSASAAQIYGMANAARGQLAGRVAAGELISIYGAGLGPAAGVVASFNSAGYLPNILGGAQVTIDGMPAPLLYVSATQINAIAPVKLSETAAVTMQVTVGNVTLPAFRLFVDPAIPEVFQSGGSAVAYNQDGTLNSQTNPAQGGTLVTVWATGTGLPLMGADGQQATVAGAGCYCSLYETGIADGPIGPPYTYVTLQYAGAAPGAATGVVQVNFQAAAGIDYYVLTANGRASDAFFVYVSP